jgi:hypothetical protein
MRVRSPFAIVAQRRDQTHRVQVRLVLTYGDVSLTSVRREEGGGPNAGAHQVTFDLMRLVNKKWLWNLSGLDLTLIVLESGHSSVESGHHLTVGVSVLAVEIGWRMFKGKRHMDGRG